MDNLFRVGIIGCLNTKTQVERWSYLGADAPIVGSDWLYIVHKGLWSELQLQQEAYDGIPLVDILGFTFECKVVRVEGKHLVLSFTVDSKRQFGRIHVKDVNGKYIKNIHSYKGKVIQAYVYDYDEPRKTWLFKGIF